VRQDSIDPVAASSLVTDTFGGIGKIQSTKARVYKWEAARELASQHPLFGSGLGIEHESFQPGAGNGFGQFQLGSTFDNIYLDLLVRSGVIGLLLFCLALSLSLRDGWYVWRNHPDSEIAALVLGATLFVAGLALKGVIESVLEKVVLACALGIALGAIAAARTALHTGDTPRSSLPRGAEPQWT
jgi:O-antigen ligase